MANIDLINNAGSPSATVVVLNGLTLLFSYRTIVAFKVAGEGWTVSENIWSQTTGRHIMHNTRVAKEDRIPHADFAARLDTALAVL